jgi:hypothetical protein
VVSLDAAGLLLLLLSQTQSGPVQLDWFAQLPSIIIARPPEL